jgi:hypothetical protein
MNLKILKLKSGEEIAGQILEETDSTIKIFQPMVFRVVSSFDDNGNPCDVTTLHDWLMNTDEKQVSLPINHITFMTEPNKETKKLYELESVKEFDKSNFKTTVKENKVENALEMNEKDADMFGAFLQDLIDSASKIDKWNKEEPPMPRRKRKAPKKNILPPDMMDESELDRHMIMMQLYIPAEAIMNMVTSGLLDPKVLLSMVKEVKKRNRFTGDEKHRKDFGDKLSDWNPDPNSDDYK